MQDELSRAPVALTVQTDQTEGVPEKSFTVHPTRLLWPSSWDFVVGSVCSGEWGRDRGYTDERGAFIIGVKTGSRLHVVNCSLALTRNLRPTTA